jgi:hypothetical protein
MKATLRGVSDDFPRTMLFKSVFTSVWDETSFTEKGTRGSLAQTDQGRENYSLDR